LVDLLFAFPALLVPGREFDCPKWTVDGCQTHIDDRVFFELASRFSPILHLRRRAPRSDASRRLRASAYSCAQNRHARLAFEQGIGLTRLGCRQKTIPSAEMNSPAERRDRAIVSMVLKKTVPHPDREKLRHCAAKRATSGRKRIWRFHFFACPGKRLLRKSRLSFYAKNSTSPEAPAQACPIFFSFNVAIISDASCASFRTIACRFRPQDSFRSQR